MIQIENNLQAYRHITDLAGLNGINAGRSRASSLLVTDHGRFLMGVRPPITERDRVLLRLTGIGGWAEGNETFVETAVREALEETGSSVDLLDLDRTLVVRSPEQIDAASVTEEATPAAVVYRRFGTAPFDPWSETFDSVSPVAVFVGLLQESARIIHPAELPYFMWVYPEQMIALADTDEPLEFLLADGAEIVGDVTFDPSRAIVRLTDSIQALVAALGPRAFTFLCDISRLRQQAADRQPG